jgi:hypothetical protein
MAARHQYVLSMTTTLTPSDAERFTIFVDSVIESPRFCFSAFCNASKLSADQAIAWVTRPDIVEALESCIAFLAAAARIRHTVLDTNAMGALGELLRTSKNEIEVRRAATTIITRHRADLHPSRASRPRATDPSADQRESASLTSELSNLKSSSASLAHDLSANPRDSASSSPAGRTMVAGGEGRAATKPPDFNAKLNSALCADELITRAFSSAALTPTPSPLNTQNSALITPRKQPHSAQSLLNRAGAPTSLSRDRPH